MNSLKTSNDLDLKKVVAFSLKSNQYIMYENFLCFSFENAPAIYKQL